MLRYRTILAGTAIVAPSGAQLWSVNVTRAAAGANISLYDGSSNGGLLVADIDGSQLGSYWFGVLCPNGIYYQNSGSAASVTIGYR